MSRGGGPYRGGPRRRHSSMAIAEKTNMNTVALPSTTRKSNQAIWSLRSIDFPNADAARDREARVRVRSTPRLRVGSDERRWGAARGSVSATSNAISVRRECGATPRLRDEQQRGGEHDRDQTVVALRATRLPNGPVGAPPGCGSDRVRVVSESRACGGRRLSTRRVRPLERGAERQRRSQREQQERPRRETPACDVLARGGLRHQEIVGVERDPAATGSRSAPRCLRPSGPARPRGGPRTSPR